MNCYSFTKFSALVASLLLATTASAQQESQNSLDYSLDTGNVEITPVGETSTIQKDEVEDDEPFLPIFGKEAREKGYELPKSYGINVNYMNIHQNINVKSIQFDGLSFSLPPIINKPMPIAPDMFKIDVRSTRQRSHTETLRLDAWVFPFMNVYGVVGHTKGRSLSKVDVGSKNPFVNSFIKGLGDMDGIDFVLKFKGTTYGLGTTFAGGVGNWFGLVDLNYTRTKLNIIDGNIKAFTLAPRVGYRFTLPAVDAIKLPQSKFSLWVGSMYQNVDQNFHGKLSKLSFSPKLQSLINFVNKGDGTFNVKQKMESPWNMLAGFRWEITPSFNIVTEAGFIKRNSFFAALEYRF